jgi:hypothetical protein
MALWARGGGPSPLPSLLRRGLFAPTLLFALHRQAEPVAILSFGLMLTTLGAIVWAARSGKSEDEDVAAPLTRSRALIRVAHADGVMADG